MLDSCLAHIMATMPADLFATLHSNAVATSSSSLCGAIYARCAVFPALRTGAGTLPLKQLPAPAPPVPVTRWPLLDGATSLDLYAALPMIRFHDTGELRCQWGSQEGDAVFVPTGIRHPVLDFVIRLGGKPLLCNCSISADPSILLANEHFVRVLHAVDLLDDGAGATRSDELAFAWVLPQAAYARFTLPGALKGGITA